MIKFFRKIRKNLPSEGKTGKYFKYANGEIFLLVIGILIALQINNWNEEHNIQGNQEKYLRLLKTEAINNLKQVTNTKGTVKTLNIWQNKIFNLINSNQDTITEGCLSKTFGQVFPNTYKFGYENSVLTEMKTSGHL
jgi:hypothetical protein